MILTTCLGIDIKLTVVEPAVDIIFIKKKREILKAHSKM